MEEKRIRFIDSNYHNLFTVPDGGNVVINHFSDGRLVRPCQYIDETHAKIGSMILHICQFAEIMERNGNTYEPEHPETVQNYAIIQRVDFDNRKGIALAYNPKAPDPYVTWVFRERPDATRDYQLGRYCGTLSSAQKSFRERRDAELENGYVKVVYAFDNTAHAPEHPPHKPSKKGVEKQRKTDHEPSR